jgi:hypothetical protein
MMIPHESSPWSVTHERPEKGMPDWSEVFSNDQFTKILTFLHTVETR